MEWIGPAVDDGIMGQTCEMGESPWGTDPVRGFAASVCKIKG